MIAKALVGVALIALAPSRAVAIDTSVAGRLDITGGLSLTAGASDSGLQSLQAGIKAKVGDIEGIILGRVRYQQLNGYPPQDIGLREAILAVRRTDYNLSIGLQQVVWGKLDALRFLDQVNPVDTANLFYEELVDSRIPLWMVNCEWFMDNGSLQLLFIPDVEFNLLPNVPTPGSRVSNASKPEWVPKNWSYGAKLSLQPGDWIVEFSALRSWDFNPVSTLSFDAFGPFIQNSYVRQTRLGMLAETRIGKTVLRAESLYVPQQFFPPTLPTSPQPTSSPVWSNGIGLDFELSSYFLSGQLLREQATQMVPGLSAETTRTYASILLQRRFLHDRLGVRAFAICGLDHHSQWVSLQSIYQVGGNHEFKVQLDVFAGEQGSFFGEFRNRDRLAFTYSYLF